VLSDRLRNNPRPLRTIKDLAYAWRQTVFFLARTEADELPKFLVWAGETIAGQPSHVAAALRPVVAGLDDVVSGDSFDANGRTQNGRRLLGWTEGPHWLLEAAGIGRRAA
jgi:hypothetical protein